MNKETTYSDIVKQQIAPMKVTEYVSKEKLQEVIDEKSGIVTLVALELGCSYRQLYNALDEYGLRDYLQQAKLKLVSKAEEVLLGAMDSDNDRIKLQAAEDVLRSKFASQIGWGTSANGVNIQQNFISDDQKKEEIKNIFSVN